MNLERELRKSNFDLIESPIRYHKPLQLWLKKPNNRIEFLHENVTDALSSNIELKVKENKALSVNYDQKQEFNFDIGLEVLEDLLKSLELGDLGLSTKFKRGKKVTVTYNDSMTLLVLRGEISNFLSTAKFIHSNREFIKNANRNNIIIISGVLMAKDIKATIETDVDISANVKAELMKMVDGKIDFDFQTDRKLELVSEGNSLFPIAVQAHRINWHKDKFKKLTLLSDKRILFN